MFKLIKLPTIEDKRGKLSYIEDIFNIQRVFYLYDYSLPRGSHAHKKCKQAIIIINGSCDVVLKNGEIEKIISMERKDECLLINTYVWVEIENFSKNCICLVLASEKYNEEDYIRDYNSYVDIVKNKLDNLEEKI
jgi:hypothetical protein